MRKPVKPTNKQKEIIETIKQEIESWKNTNDLDSPTLRSDIDESLKIFDIDPVIKSGIAATIRLLLTQIKRIKNE